MITSGNLGTDTLKNIFRGSVITGWKLGDITWPTGHFMDSVTICEWNHKVAAIGNHILAGNLKESINFDQTKVSFEPIIWPGRHFVKHKVAETICESMSDNSNSFIDENL
jgi:hypothetical protein